jgi:hypothetical protein
VRKNGYLRTVCSKPSLEVEDFRPIVSYLCGEMMPEGKACVDFAFRLLYNKLKMSPYVWPCSLSDRAFLIEGDFSERKICSERDRGKVAEVMG